MTSHLVSASIQAENDNQSLTEYEPYALSQKSAKKIMMLDTKGHVIGMPSYAHYVDVISTSSTYLWIVFSTSAFQLKGRHLPEQILYYLQDDRISRLQCYTPTRFTLPDEPVPVIETITRHALKDYMLMVNQENAPKQTQR